jgi:hypothetical protein
MEYLKFLECKKIKHTQSGFEISRDKLSPMLFDYQKDLVLWALKIGRAALFTMTGTGKTLMQVEYARQVQTKIGGNVLIFAPLAVSAQTIREALKIGVNINYAHNQAEVKPGITITNYERIENFEADKFVCVVLDESSILKGFDSSTRGMLVDNFKDTPYKLACTATPAPNDFMELGNHSEFLNVITRTEMLSMFFVHDGGDTSKWRLKGHAKDKFWEWCASWAAILSKPSDLGYSDEGFILPELRTHEIVTPSEAPAGMLFAFEAQTLEDRRLGRQSSFKGRVARCADIVNKSDGNFLVWCDLNIESDLLRKSIPGCVEVKGSDSVEHKEKSLLDFAAGKIKCLVSKPSICGYGMNFQICHKMAFVGLSDSFEQYFQAVRRCWRFGQKKPVDVYIITSEAEGAVVKNIKRKEREASVMIASMVEHTRSFVMDNLHKSVKLDRTYQPGTDIIIPAWLKSEKGE